MKYDLIEEIKKLNDDLIIEYIHNTICSDIITFISLYLTSLSISNIGDNEINGFKNILYKIGD